MAAIKKLNESQLLIGVDEGTTLTAENWNSVMRSILEAINTNADAVNTTIAAPIAVRIYPEGTQTNFTWFRSAPRLAYHCIFEKSILNKQGTVSAHFYNIEGEEVSCNYTQDNEIITVYSRVNKEILAVFR